MFHWSHMPVLRRFLQKPDINKSRPQKKLVIIVYHVHGGGPLSYELIKLLTHSSCIATIHSYLCLSSGSLVGSFMPWLSLEREEETLAETSFLAICRKKPTDINTGCDQSLC